MRLLALLLMLTLAARAGEVSLDRIVVIGASVSRGFTESQPLGGEKADRLRLDRYLDAALTAPHGPIVNDANHLLFTATERDAGRQLARLGKRDPTVVVAVDFLFWFLYGYPERTGDRLELFDRGLGLLSQIDCPLVIGDIPDASASIGRMLSRPMVPDAATIAEANRRLAEWAKPRPRVAVVPLARFMTACQADRAIHFGRHAWPEGRTRSLLQPDRLHPTPDGCAALSLAILAGLTEKGLPEDAIDWTPEQIRDQADPSTGESSAGPHHPEM